MLKFDDGHSFVGYTPMCMLDHDPSVLTHFVTCLNSAQATIARALSGRLGKRNTKARVGFSLIIVVSADSHIIPGNIYIIDDNIFSIEL